MCVQYECLYFLPLGNVGPVVCLFKGYTTSFISLIFPSLCPPSTLLVDCPQA